MTSPRGSKVGDKYVLPTGSDDAARAADIGCGTGEVSRWIASRMGPAARVDAIDIAPEQIEVAKGIEAKDGASPIHYQVGSAYEPRLPEGVYDVVFCGLVLCHLQDPQKAVDRMARLLRPGGRLVLVDMDLRDTFTMPHCAFYPAYIDECVIPYETKINIDYSVGLKRPQLITGAGLMVEFVTADQPIFRDGPGKHLWEVTWTFALQRAAQEGVITMERGMELIAGMQEHPANAEVWVAVAKMFAAVGEKPVS